MIPSWIIAGCGDGDLFSEASNASKQLVRNRHFCWFYSRHSVSGNVVNKYLYFIDTWMFIDYLLRHICIFFTMKSNLLKRGLKQRFLLLTESMAGCAESVSTNLCPGLQFVRRHATLENYPFVIFPISRILLGWITLDFTDIHVKFCTPSIRKPRAAELGYWQWPGSWLATRAGNEGARSFHNHGEGNAPTRAQFHVHLPWVNACFA